MSKQIYVNPKFSQKLAHAPEDRVLEAPQMRSQGTFVNQIHINPMFQHSGAVQNKLHQTTSSEKIVETKVCQSTKPVRNIYVNPLYKSAKAELPKQMNCEQSQNNVLIEQNKLNEAKCSDTESLKPRKDMVSKTFAKGVYLNPKFYGRTSSKEHQFDLPMKTNREVSKKVNCNIDSKIVGKDMPKPDNLLKPFPDGVHLNPKFSSSLKKEQEDKCIALNARATTKCHINPDFCEKSLLKSPSVQKVKGKHVKEGKSISLKQVHVNPNFCSSSEILQKSKPQEISVDGARRLPNTAPLNVKVRKNVQNNNSVKQHIHVNPRFVKTFKNDSLPLSQEQHAPQNVVSSEVNIASEAAFPLRLSAPKASVINSPKFMKLGRRKIVRRRASSGSSSKASKNNTKTAKLIKPSPGRKWSANQFKFTKKNIHRSSETNVPVKKDVHLISLSRSKLVRRSCLIKRKSSTPSEIPRNIRKFLGKQRSPAKLKVLSRYKYVRRNSGVFKNKGRVPTSPKLNTFHNMDVLAKRIVKKYSVRTVKSENKSSAKPSATFRSSRTWRIDVEPRKRSLQSQIRSNTSRDGLRTQRNLKLVRIGGLLYHSTTSKLQRKRSDSSRLSFKMRSSFGKSPRSPLQSKLKNTRGGMIFIKGRKFFIDSTGKTLKCVTTEEKKALSENSEMNNVRRISLGGSTFIRKSKNVLVRSSAPQASHRVSQAVQKSISTLTKKKRKNNMICIFYKRFGKCFRHEKNTCPYVHDPKKVDICKRFLAGLCEQSDCPLFHHKVPEKMPTCQYFLEGCCNRPDCPYLHVKVNANAELCLQFLEGFCSKGQECLKRHELLCPEFEKLGTCSKGKYCPFPHKNCRTSKNQSRHNGKELTGRNKGVCKVASKSTAEEKKRYYDVSVAEEEKGIVKDEEPSGEQVSGSQEQVSNSQENLVCADSLQEKRKRLLRKVEILKSFWQNPDESIHASSACTVLSIATSDQEKYSRPKLGFLPAFIPI